MSYDLNDELAHCRHMVSATDNALAPYIQEIELYGELSPSDREPFEKLKRQRTLWEQLANELDDYLTKDDDTDQADLFSEAAGA